jgi:hypothetical protein
MTAAKKSPITTKTMPATFFLLSSISKPQCLSSLFCYPAVHAQEKDYDVIIVDSLSPKQLITRKIY